MNERTGEWFGYFVKNLERLQRCKQMRIDAVFADAEVDYHVLSFAEDGLRSKVRECLFYAGGLMGEFDASAVDSFMHF